MHSNSPGAQHQFAIFFSCPSMLMICWTSPAHSMYWCEWSKILADAHTRYRYIISIYIIQNLCQNSMKELWTGGDLVREHTPSHSNVFVSSKETHRMPIYYRLGYFLVGEPSKHYVNMHIDLSIYICKYAYHISSALQSRCKLKLISFRLCHTEESLKKHDT